MFLLQWDFLWQLTLGLGQDTERTVCALSLARVSRAQHGFPVPGSFLSLSVCPGVAGDAQGRGSGLWQWQRWPLGKSEGQACKPGGSMRTSLPHCSSWEQSLTSVCRRGENAISCTLRLLLRAALQAKLLPQVPMGPPTRGSLTAGAPAHFLQASPTSFPLTSPPGSSWLPLLLLTLLAALLCGGLRPLGCLADSGCSGTSRPWPLVQS